MQMQIMFPKMSNCPLNISVDVVFQWCMFQNFVEKKNLQFIKLLQNHWHAGNWNLPGARDPDGPVIPALPKK